MNNLPNVVLTGAEHFSANGCSLDHSIKDFWSWYASDLVSNAMRGVLAEYIVALALGLENGKRTEWDAYDLETPDGLKIEVKSAAYIQAWQQKEYSQISFDIAPKKFYDYETNTYGEELKRHADVYVFCLLKHQDSATLDPVNLDQWTFLVLPTLALDKNKPSQKTIGLNPLKKLYPFETNFPGLRIAIRRAAMS